MAIPDYCQLILEIKPYRNFVNEKIMAIQDYCQLILEIKPYRNFVNDIIMAIPDDCQLIYEIKPYRKFVNEKVMAVQYFCQCLYTYSGIKCNLVFNVFSGLYLKCYMHLINCIWIRNANEGLEIQLYKLL